MSDLITDILTLGLSAVNRGVWKAYDFPRKMIIGENGNIAQGSGVYADRGVFTVILPKTLKHIGKYAFQNCKDISEVIFKSDLQKIPEGCFKNCIYLSDVKFCKDLVSVSEGKATVTLNEDLNYYNLTQIEDYAFCKTLLSTSAINKLLYKVTDIGAYAFAGSLAACIYHPGRLTLEELNQLLSSSNAIIRIRNSVKKIGKYAFSGSNLFLFEWKDLSNLDIDPKAFSTDYTLYGDYNPYLNAMPKTFIVPQDMYDEYKQFFHNLGITDNITIIVYSGEIADKILTYKQNLTEVWPPES